MKYKIFSLFVVVSLIFVSCDDMSRNYYMYDQDPTILCDGGSGGGNVTRRVFGNRNNGSYRFSEDNVGFIVEWRTDANGRVTATASKQVHFPIPHTVHFAVREAIHSPLNHSIRVTIIGEIRTNSEFINPGQSQGRIPFHHFFIVNIDDLFP